MATTEDITRLKHMLEAAQKAMYFTQDRSRRDLDADEVLTLAMVRLLEIVGEAARNISDSIKDKYPAVPWKPIAAHTGPSDPWLFRCRSGHRLADHHRRSPTLDQFSRTNFARRGGQWLALSPLTITCRS